MIRRQWSLALLLPGGVLLTFLLILLAALVHADQLRKQALLQNLQQQAKNDAVSLTRYAERFLEIHPEVVAEEIGHVATDSYLSVVVLVDAGNQIRFSNQSQWRNQSAAAVFSELQLQRLQQATQTRLASLFYDVEHARLEVYMSFAISSRVEPLRVLERGAVVLNYDLSSLETFSVGELVGTHMIELAALLLGALLLLIILHAQVIRPLQNINTYAAAIARGDFNRTWDSPSYASEISNLQQTLRQMSQKLAAQMLLLEEEAERTQAIIDNMVDGVITISEQGEIRSFNLAAERIFGYTPDQVQGKNVKMLMPSPYYEQHDEYLLNYLHTGKAQIIGIGREVEGKRSNGECFPLELAVSEVNTQRGRLFLGLVRDVTERKQVEKMKSEFISTVSHELRTPLTAINGALKLIASGAMGRLSDSAGPLLDIALRNSERLLFLINDLLDMEKLEAGKFTLDIRPQSLQRLLQQAEQVNSTYGLEREVGLDFHLLPEPVVVAVDGQRLLQVLSNFLSNAIKFSPTGARVALHMQLQRGWVTVTVTDSGPGIPAEFHDRLFTKFSQFDASNTRQQGGTGLGLAISKALIEQMGGKIGFHSVAGSGASFYFSLRVSAAADDAG